MQEVTRPLPFTVSSSGIVKSLTDLFKINSNKMLLVYRFLIVIKVRHSMVIKMNFGPHS